MITCVVHTRSLPWSVVGMGVCVCGMCAVCVRVCSCRAFRDASLAVLACIARGVGRSPCRIVTCWPSQRARHAPTMALHSRCVPEQSGPGRRLSSIEALLSSTRQILLCASFCTAGGCSWPVFFRLRGLQALGGYGTAGRYVSCIYHIITWLCL